MKTLGRLWWSDTPGKGRFALANPKGTKPLPTQPELLALLRNQPAIVGKSFSEQDHPRGQPDNAGKFTAGEGGGKGKLAPIENTPEPGEAAPTHQQWQERDSARGDRREALSEAEEMADMGNSYPSAEALFEAISGVNDMHEELRLGTAVSGDLQGKLSKVVEAYNAHSAEIFNSLKDAGATDNELKKLAKVQTKNAVPIGKAVDAYLSRAKAVEELQSKVSELAEAEPDTDSEAPNLPPEPMEPEIPARHEQRDIPDEPMPGDSDNYDPDHAEWLAESQAITVQNAKAEQQANDAYAEWQNKHDSWEAECERIQEQHDTKMERAHDVWDKQMGVAQAKLDAAEEKFSEAAERFEEVVQEADGKVQDTVADLSQEIGIRIDDEEADDEELEGDDEEIRKDFCHKTDFPRMGLQEKAFDENKHPRGGDKENPGRFSQGQGGGKGKLEPKPERTGEQTEIAPPKDEQLTENPEDEDFDEDFDDDDMDLMPPSVQDNPIAEQYKENSKEAAKQYATVDSLASNKVIVTPKSMGTVNDTLYHMEFADGFKGLGKTPENEKHHEQEYGVPQGEAYKRESVAFQVAEIFGFGDLVPPTIKREIPGVGEGSVQSWVPTSKGGKIPVVARNVPEDIKFDGGDDLARAAAFDFLMGARDRHEKNWMLHGDGYEKLALIDNGLTLPEGNESGDKIGSIRSGLFTAAYQKDLPIPKMDLSDTSVKKMVGAMKNGGISDKAVGAFLQRVEMVKKASAGGGATFRHLPVMSNDAKHPSDWEFST